MCSDARCAMFWAVPTRWLKPMNRYLKYGLAVPAGGLVLFAVLALVASLAINPNDYKPQIIRLVKEKKQRTLILAGDIRLAFFPKLGLDLGRASMSEFGSEKEFAAVDGVRLYLSWWPLLKKELVVDQVRVEGLRASLVRFRDGTTNVDDLLRQEEEDRTIRFAIDGVKISNSALSLRDEMSGRQFALNGIEFGTGRLAAGRSTELEAGFRLTGDNPRLDLQTRVTGELFFDGAGKRYAFRNFSLEARGEAAGMRDMVTGLKGNIELDGESHALTLENLALAVTRRQGASDLDVRLTAPRIVHAPQHLAAGKIELVARMQDGRDETSMLLSVPEISGEPDAFRGRLRFEANVHQGESTMAAKLDSSLAGNLKQGRLDLPGLRMDLALNHPKAPRSGVKAALAGNALLDLKKQSTSLNADGNVDDSRLRIRLGVAPLSRPHLSFDAGVDRIDFDRYLAAAGSASGKPQPDQGVKTDAPRGLSANGVLRAGLVRLYGVQARNVRLDIRIGDGKLDVSPFAMLEETVKGRVREEVGNRLGDELKRQFFAR